MKLEDLTPDAVVGGLVPDGLATVVAARFHGPDAVELTYKDADGRPRNALLYRADEARLSLAEHGRPWAFDGDGAAFRLVSEAQRIRLAHLFDPLLAVHTSLVEPLPHQITAVYETMLQRQPLRFLLADDPGAGKTIMAGLLIKELIARGDLQRCLIVCPGSLAEQWQDELDQKFGLPFDILTNDGLEAARTGNWFLEHPFAIARLDKLARDEDAQARLRAPDAFWDLIVCDEAHKMSATYFGNEAKYTKRYHLGRELSSLTRHFLLMSATPHNGKEADFQLFMALLDGERFEGRFRDGAHSTDASDLMRRTVKEGLVRFDGTPLFPERRAETVSYELSDLEAALYQEVTSYVREEFNRADKLQNEKKVTVGFALTTLQRRLASSPEAIYQSLVRRRERLAARLRELKLLQRGASLGAIQSPALRLLNDEAMDDLDEATDAEVATTEAQTLDLATAAQTVSELEAEIETLSRLEARAQQVRSTGEDRKWRELLQVLDHIFGAAAAAVPPAPPASQKLVIFTEHRDTLNYLTRRIGTHLGRPEAVVVIHGGMGREERKKAQEAFWHDPQVQILLATDAAGEGINLQRAHLMVNYDLPWNPNRLEQRFGRIHRIGQTEVCFLWNLVARDTREGEVYLTLLAKLEEARAAMGGQVFDVLGQIQFDGKPLRELLVEAIRYGDQPEVRARLTQKVAGAVNTAELKALLNDHALVPDVMDAGRVARVREDMERAEARRLQPHYIGTFFLEAFEQLGGTARKREPGRYQITHVPSTVRSRDRLIGTAAPLLSRYERIAFDKADLAPPGQSPAAFVCPGHPLLDAVIDLTLERHRQLLRQGAVLVNDRDPGLQPRVVFSLEHTLQDASLTRAGEPRAISRRLLYVAVDADGGAHHLHGAPYLDFRPLAADEPTVDALLARPEAAWIRRELEDVARAHAAAVVVPEHLAEIRDARLTLIARTEAAVKDRLTREIHYWDHRAAELRAMEIAGKVNARLNSQEAAKRADALLVRLETRQAALAREKVIAPLPPVVLGGFLVVPAGLIAAMQGRPLPPAAAVDTQASAARAREIVMAVERGLGFEPVDRERDQIGFDIESRVPGAGKLRFIEVKGRVSGAATITVTRNEILTSLTTPDNYILALVEFLDGERHTVHYLRRPFTREPDFGVTSVNYDFAELLRRAEKPS